MYLGPAATEQAVPYKSAFLVQQLLMGGMREPGGTSQSLWGYVSNFRDTDFGGKTGTSNNHSDAWFMGVTPKLVVGAWVGGEYRSIHFRTGALGQGSRTALPICGYFLQSVLGDPPLNSIIVNLESHGMPTLHATCTCVLATIRTLKTTQQKQTVPGAGALSF